MAAHRNRKLHLILSGAVCALIAAGAARAETTAEDRLALLDDRNFDRITVIGTKKDAAAIAGSAFIVDDAELAEFEPTNIHNILRRVPGVYLREEDGHGTFPRIGIRASSSGRSDRIAIMEDGVPAAMAPYGNVSAYYFPVVARMSAVEVLKGPEILRYGPQTTSGALNLVSTPIPDEAFAAYLQGEYGINDTRRAHAWAGGVNGQFGFLVETYYHQTDGWQHYRNFDDTTGNRINEVVAKLRWSSPDGARFAQQADLKFQYGDEYADVSYLGLTDADFRADPDRRYDLSRFERMNRGRIGGSFRHTISFADNIDLNTTAYWTRTHRNYTRLNQINGVGIGETGVTWAINNGLANAALLQGILDGTADTTHPNGVRYGNNFQNFLAKGVQMEAVGRFATGALDHEASVSWRWHHDRTGNTATISNLIYNQIGGDLVFAGSTAGSPSNGEASAWSVVVADKIALGALTFTPIVRFEDIDSIANRANPSGARNSLRKVTAGAGLSYASGDNWTLFAGVHQGFAPPGASATVGTKGEESLNFETGARYRNGAFAFDVIGFYTDYSNALRNCLFANPCPGGIVEGTQQTGSKEVYGLEFAAHATLIDDDAFSVPVRAAYTYTAGEYTRDSDTGNVLKGDVLDHTPKHVAYGQIGVVGASGWSLFAALNYADGACTTTTCRRAGVDATFLETESLLTVDLSASAPIARTVDLYVKAENVFDERSIVHRGADGARGNAARYVGGGFRARF